jgi:hypothetical protein
LFKIKVKKTASCMVFGIQGLNGNFLMERR